MEIKTITRLISDPYYGNLSMTAELKEGENVEKACIELDQKIRKAIRDIDINAEKIADQKNQSNEAVRILEDAIRKVKREIDELPF